MKAFAAYASFLTIVALLVGYLSLYVAPMINGIGDEVIRLQRTLDETP